MGESVLNKLPNLKLYYENMMKIPEIEEYYKKDDVPMLSKDSKIQFWERILQQQKNYYWIYFLYYY